jgi:hypothetical protein
MNEKEFLNGIANGKADVLQILLDIMDREGIAYCVIGGLAVNAYVEPVVSLDLDMVVAASSLMRLKRAVAEAFKVKEFPYSINLYSEDSDLRIQIQTDSRYQAFVGRAEEHKVLGYTMMVASLEDVLRGKVWAYSDEQRRRSKRQKDLADIFRIIESYPALESMLPTAIRDRM